MTHASGSCQCYRRDWPHCCALQTGTGQHGRSTQQQTAKPSPSRCKRLRSNGRIRRKHNGMFRDNRIVTDPVKLSLSSSLFGQGSLCPEEPTASNLHAPLTNLDQAFKDLDAGLCTLKRASQPITRRHRRLAVSTPAQAPPDQSDRV